MEEVIPETVSHQRNTILKRDCITHEKLLQYCNTYVILVEEVNMSKITLAQLGLIAKEQRGGRGIREVAAEIGISAATLSRIETGKQPDLETFSRLCKWLNLNPGEILGHSTSDPTTSIPGDGAFQNFSVQFRAPKTIQPETAKRLGELILAVHASIEREQTTP